MNSCCGRPLAGKVRVLQGAPRSPCALQGRCSFASRALVEPGLIHTRLLFGLVSQLLPAIGGMLAGTGQLSSDKHISEEDYDYAHKVWKAFDWITLGDHYELYNHTDVLLLAHVFKTFRTICLRQKGLDPAYYYTSTGHSCDTLLKKTGVELELLTDYYQHLLIENGMASKWFARTNIPHIEGYDQEKLNSHILHLDANNMYWWAMSHPLPMGAF